MSDEKVVRIFMTVDDKIYEMNDDGCHNCAFYYNREHCKYSFISKHGEFTDGSCGITGDTSWKEVIPDGSSVRHRS